MIVHMQELTFACACVRARACFLHLCVAYVCVHAMRVKNRSGKFVRRRGRALAFRRFDWQMRSRRDAGKTEGRERRTAGRASRILACMLDTKHLSRTHAPARVHPPMQLFRVLVRLLHEAGPASTMMPIAVMART